MKIELWVIGKTKSKDILSAEREYLKRLSKFLPLDYIVIPELKSRKAYREDQQKTLEGEEIQKRLEKTPGYLILLDASGSQYTSEEFSSYCNLLMQRSEKRIVFLIGGPYGFSPEIEACAGAKLSLSKMTFPHDIARLVFLEQLYRAMAILKNLPYHH